jgi:hypothetical protein
MLEAGIDREGARLDQQRAASNRGAASAPITEMGAQF